MFFEDIKEYGDKVAIITETRKVSYIQLHDLINQLYSEIPNTRSLILIDASNEIEPLCAYIGAMQRGHAVILSSFASSANEQMVVERYQPQYIFKYTEDGWNFEATQYKQALLHQELALMLSTSGTTGSPKMVKLSYENLLSNASSIAEYLNIQVTDRAITTLPIHYSYGLSVVNSHFLSGATILLTDRSVTDKKFWSFLSREKATSFSGVPYTFELLKKTDFIHGRYSSLQKITQAGGKLHEEDIKFYKNLSDRFGWDFYIMYGQTEATARMAYLPPEDLDSNIGTIGRAIPGGEFELRDDENRLIKSINHPGELVYSGANVMMGYAYNADDLISEADEKRLYTGDLAIKNENGYFKIVGRKSRFAKIFGLRISFDEIESYLLKHGYKGLCFGDDSKIAIGIIGKADIEAIGFMLSSHYGLPAYLFHIIEIDEPPLLANGKTDYQWLLKNAPKISVRPGSGNVETQKIHAIYANTFKFKDVDGNQSFTSLGGDSLSYVDISTQLETVLGFLPDNWENKTIQELEAIELVGNTKSSMETNLVLRAIAIVSVVSHHSTLWAFGGAASFLMLLAGFNLARFSRKPLYDNKSKRDIFVSIYKLLIPYFLILMAYQIYKKDFDVESMLLLGNFVDRQRTFIEPFWFIQAFIQCNIVFILIFSIKITRACANAQEYMFAYLMLFFSLALKFGMPYFLSLDGQPSYYLWNVLFLFSFGWLMYVSHSILQRVLTSLAWLMLAMVVMNFQLTSTWLLCFYVLLMLWVPRLYIPNMIKPIIRAISSNSYYIYILHGIPVYFIVYRYTAVSNYWALFLGVISGVAVGEIVRNINVFSKFTRQTENKLVKNQ